MSTAKPEPRHAPAAGRPAISPATGSAALVGGTVLAFLVGLAVTVFVPGHDGLDEAFLGGLAVLVTWPIAILWILFATSGRAAWKRVLVPGAFLLVADLAGLLA
ncbi:MAG: hypothetical protein AAF725_06340 [Acidobacteriota bacterium]